MDPDDGPCWERDGTVCAWVYDLTGGNEAVARVSNWLVDRPLQILIILLVAYVLVRFVRRWVVRWVTRAINPDFDATVKRLERIGVTPPPSLVTDLRDPRRHTRSEVIASVISGSLAVMIWTIAVITVAGVAGLELGPLIAGAGIAGVAVGFGAQSLVRDWIAGLFVLLEDHYGIGDVVDLGEASGAVEHFTLRATTLRSVDGTVWHVPNGIVTRVGNMSQLWSVALLDIDVAYDSDLDAVRTLLHETADEVCRSEEFAEHVLETPEVLGIEHFGPDGITLRLRVKTVPGQQWALQRELRRAIKDAFDRAGVEIPFPQRTVWMRLEPSDTQPDGSERDETGPDETNQETEP